MSIKLATAWNQSGRGQDPFSLAVDNKNLYCFGQYGSLQINAIPLSTLQNYATLSPQTASAVTNSKLSFPGYSDNHSQSPSGTALAVAGGNVCAFWNDDRQGCCVAISTDPTTTGAHN